MNRLELELDLLRQSSVFQADLLAHISYADGDLTFAAAVSHNQDAGEYEALTSRAWQPKIGFSATTSRDLQMWYIQNDSAMMEEISLREDEQ